MGRVNAGSHAGFGIINSIATVCITPSPIIVTARVTSTDLNKDIDTPRRKINKKSSRAKTAVRYICFQLWL